MVFKIYHKGHKIQHPAENVLLSPPPDGNILQLLLAAMHSVNKMAGAESRVSEIRVLYLLRFCRNR